ncbi:MAG: AAA family ATPase [Actinomycetales bacterium]
MTSGGGARSVPSATLAIPHPLYPVVSRTRLIQLLPLGPGRRRGRRIVLVSAPAGYGKTTLLAGTARRLRAQGSPVSWVTCTEEPGNPTFWPALTQGLIRSLIPYAPAAVDALRQLEPSGARTRHDFLAPFLAALDLVPAGTVIVLDDLHHLDGGPVPADLNHLIEQLPEQVDVFLGSRSLPELDLARWRVSGRLVQLCMSDLAFTPTEAEQFARGSSVDVDATTWCAVVARTEGWPAALRLALLTLAETEDRRTFMADFLVNDRAVAEYLAGEVLARLPADLHAFMRSTCVVEAMNADLAAALSDRQDAGAVLLELERRNALIVRLGSSGTWFRYHELIRDHLRADLVRTDPRRLSALNARAAGWYADHGRVGTALDLAVTAGHDELAIELLRSHGLSLLLAGRPEPVRRAVGAPSVTFAESPVLAVHRALLALEEGDLLTADEALATWHRIPAVGDFRTRSLYAVAELQRERLRADGARESAGRLAAELVTANGEFAGASAEDDQVVDPDVRLVALANRGALRLWRGEYTGARSDLEEAARLARHVGLPYLSLYCQSLAPGSYVHANDFQGALASAESAIAYATEKGWAESPRASYPYLVAGWAAFLMLDPELAYRRAGQALDILGAGVDVEVDPAARAGHAVIEFDLPGRQRSSFERLQALTGWLSHAPVSPALWAIIAEHHLRMALSLSEWSVAEGVVSSAHERFGDIADVLVLRARLAYARHRYTAARRHLAPVLNGSPDHIHQPALTMAWLLEALLAQRDRTVNRADAAVLHALDLAAGSGATRAFYDAGSDLRPVLVRLQGRAGQGEGELATVRAGLARMDDWTAAHLHRPAEPTPSNLDTALSERELQVLRELPSLRTLSEIAGAQSVSVNTVKTHVRSIYTKLAVTNRRGAVEAARLRGLL